MSEEEDVEKLSSDDLISFLEYRNAQKECEACGQKNWTTIADTEAGNSIGVPLVNVNSIKLLSTGLSTACLICNNCGNMRLFWRDTIMKWKRTREVSKNG